MSESDTNNINNLPSRSAYNLSSTSSQTGDNVIITLPETGPHPIRSELVLTAAKQEKTSSSSMLSIREAQQQQQHHHKQSPKSYTQTLPGELQGISKKQKAQKYGQKIELSKNKNPPIKIKLERMVRTNKLLWTAELHRIFLNAVRKLGMESTPNAIREEMNVEGLTRDNVASHLQKYRTRVRAAKTEDEKAALLKQEEEFLSQSDDSQSFSSPPPPSASSTTTSSASAIPTYSSTAVSQQTLTSADTFNLLNIATPSSQLFSGMSAAPQFSNYALSSMLPQTSYLQRPQQAFSRTPQLQSVLPSAQTLPSFNANYFYPSQQGQITTAQPQQQQQQQQSATQQQQQQTHPTPQPGQQLYYLRQAEELKEEFKDYNHYYHN